MSDSEREKVILAATMAATFRPDFMTNDKVEAATKGHGTLVVPVLVAANSIADDLLKGLDISLVDASSPDIPLDIIIDRAVKAAMSAGASPENAALIVAALAYFSGAAARAGVPMANRKLGAMARMHAGAPRTSAIALTTNKFTHRITAFPAYKAIYEMLMEKKLIKLDGGVLPPFIAGGAIYGHSKLGEDIVVPELAKEAAKVGALAMKNAMEGAGMTAYPLWPALIAAAVTMEIVHPDSFLGEEYGPFGSKFSSYAAGQGAVEAMGLPPKIHVRGTGEEYDTAQVIGDFGLILKDIGGPSVIGMMALNEIFAGFMESSIIGAGFSGGPVNPPLGHLCGDSVPAIKLLLKNKGDVYATAEEIKKYKMESFFDPEMALTATNTIARVAEWVKRGPVTKALMLAGEDVRDRAIYRRAAKAYEMLKAGKSLEEVTKALDDERKEYVEKRAAAMLGAFLGKNIEIKFTELRPQARRHDPFTEKYWGFDSYISYDITIDGKKYHIENLSAKTVPEFALEGKGRDDPDYANALFVGAVVAQELQYIGHTIINITVPAAVAAILGMDPKEASKKAENGAYLTRAIPGAKYAAREVAAVAKKLYSMISTEKHEILPS